MKTTTKAHDDERPISSFPRVQTAVRSTGASLGKVKGAMLGKWLEWQERTVGSAALGTIAGRLPEELRALVDPTAPALGIQGALWYPIELAHRLTELSIEKVPERARDDVLRVAARETMRAMLQSREGGTYSMLAERTRYARLLNAQWRAAYDTGSLQLVPRGPTSHELTAIGWKGHHPIVCKFNAYTQEPLYEAMGFRNVGIEQVACVARGGSACRTLVTWQA